MPVTDNLGNRMKQYEGIERKYLYKKMPVIIRLDGKSFHTFTKGCDKPFDKKIISAMESTGKYLMENIQGCKIAYVQSDEINLFLSDYDEIETCAWFDNNVNKMVSISAAMASVHFTFEYSRPKFPPFIKPAHFDSRAFNIPKEEVINLFRWRYLDWLRNSIQMLAQSLYSQKELHGKKKDALHEMCFQKGHNWNVLDSQFKNGTLFVKELKYIPEVLYDNPETKSKCTMYNEVKEIVRYTDFNLMSPEWLKKINEVVGV